MDTATLPVDKVTIIRSADEAAKVEAGRPVAVMIESAEETKAALAKLNPDLIRIVVATEGVTGPGYMNAAYWPTAPAQAYILTSDINDSEFAKLIDEDKPVYSQLSNGSLYQVYYPLDVASVVIDDTEPEAGQYAKPGDPQKHASFDPRQKSLGLFDAPSGPSKPAPADPPSGGSGGGGGRQKSLFDGDGNAKDWQPYTGANGGRGWINTITGEVRYQTEKPGTTRKEAEPEKPKDAPKAQQPASDKKLTDEQVRDAIVGGMRKQGPAEPLTRQNYTDQLWQRIQETFDEGNTLYVNTQLRSTRFDPQNRELMKLVDGEIRIPEGKKWVTVGQQSIDSLAGQVGMPARHQVPLTEEESAEIDRRHDEEDAKHQRWWDFINKEFDGDEEAANLALFDSEFKANQEDEFIADWKAKNQPAPDSLDSIEGDPAPEPTAVEAAEAAIANLPNETQEDEAKLAELIQQTAERYDVDPETLWGEVMYQPEGASTWPSAAKAREQEAEASGEPTEELSAEELFDMWSDDPDNTELRDRYKSQLANEKEMSAAEIEDKGPRPEVDLTGYPPKPANLSAEQWKSHVDGLRAKAKDYDDANPVATTTDVTPAGYGPRGDEPDPDKMYAEYRQAIENLKEFDDDEETRRNIEEHYDTARDGTADLLLTKKDRKAMPALAEAVEGARNWAGRDKSRSVAELGELNDFLGEVISGKGSDEEPAAGDRQLPKTGNPAVDWMIERSKPMQTVPESLREDPEDIPESGIFEGKLPHHMNQRLKKHVEENQAGSSRSHGSTGTLYNFSDDDGNTYSLSIDWKSGKARLTWDHRKVESADNPDSIPDQEQSADQEPESPAEAGEEAADAPDETVSIQSTDPIEFASLLTGGMLDDATIRSIDPEILKSILDKEAAPKQEIESGTPPGGWSTADKVPSKYKQSRIAAKLEAAALKAWTMTGDEFVGKSQFKGDAGSAYSSSVFDAIKRGEKIPQEVLDQPEYGFKSTIARQKAIETMGGSSELLGKKITEVTEEEYLQQARARELINAASNQASYENQLQALIERGPKTKRPASVRKFEEEKAQLQSQVNWAKKQQERARSAMKGGEDVNENTRRQRYRQEVKKLISKGEVTDPNIIAQHPEFQVARDARERYEKGWNTSFANQSLAVDTSRLKSHGYKVKRQDGKEMTTNEHRYVDAMVNEVFDAVGDLSDLMRETNITIAHTRGKHPFLSQSGGQYMPGEGTVTVGVSDVLGRPIPAGAHELGHWLDYEGGAARSYQTRVRHTKGRSGKLFDCSSTAEKEYWNGDHVTKAAAMLMNDDYLAGRLIKKKQKNAETDEEKAQIQRDVLKLGPYFKSPREIWARLFEQYVADQLENNPDIDHGQRSGGFVSVEPMKNYYKHPAHWNEQAWAKLKPLVEKEIQRNVEAIRAKAAAKRQEDA